MKEAHQLHKSNKRMGWSWALRMSWMNAKTRVRNAEIEAKNEAIRQMWKKEAEAKQQAKIAAENARFEASGMDLHTYTMTNYYASNAYNGD